MVRRHPCELEAHQFFLKKNNNIALAIDYFDDQTLLG